MARTILLTATILLAAAARLTAQDQWGVNLGVTPTWQTGPGANALFGADRVDVQDQQVPRLPQRDVERRIAAPDAHRLGRVRRLDQ